MILLSLSFLCFLGGLCFGGLYATGLYVYSMFSGSQSNDLGPFFVLSVLAFLCGGAFFLSSCLFKKEGKIERVVPITQHNTSSLPPAESLVRASSIPPSQQAELLRSAQYGEETPAEELLRASTTDGQGGT